MLHVEMRCHPVEVALALGDGVVSEEQITEVAEGRGAVKMRLPSQVLP